MSTETAMEPQLPISNLKSLQRLWQIAGPRRRDLVAAVLFRCLQSSFLGLSYLAAIQLLLGLLDGRDITAQWILQIGAMCLASVAGQVFCSFLSVRRAWDASFKVGAELRLRLLAHLQSLPMGFHLSRHSGDSATALSSDVAMVESFLSDALAKIVQAILLPLMLLSFVTLQSPQMAMALPISIVCAVPLIAFIARRFAKIGLKRQDEMARAGAVMIEYMQGIHVIRAFNQIAAGQEMFRAALEDFRDLSIRMVMLLAFPMVIYAALVMMGVPIAAVAAGLWHQAIEPASLILTFMLIFAVYAPLVGLAAVLERIRIADASLARLDRILSAQPLPVGSKTTRAAELDVQFSDVSFGYRPEAPVLKDITFSTLPRSMTAIVGPSGSGKSTIINLLARFWDVDAGHICIGGIDIREIEPAHLSSLISVVFQQDHLFSGTVRSNIAIAKPDATQDEIEAAAKKARAHDFIAALPNGYDTQMGEGGARFSGGERQRIAIARAILKDAPIVLLDEATSALDSTNERAIQEALQALVADKTLIVVAHKLSTIETADQILVLQDGTIHQSGDHASLLQGEGLYARMYARKSQAETWCLTQPRQTEDAL